MLSRLGRHVRSNVVAYLALFVALGGTSAYAANTVFSSDIVDGQVMNVDLANNAVTSAKINDGAVQWPDLSVNSVTSSRVKDGTLLGLDLTPNTVTGSQVDESTLGTVPSANDASTLQGLPPSSFIQGNGNVVDFRTSFLLGNNGTIANLPGGFRMDYFCNASNGQYGFATGNEAATVWADNGGTNPTTLFVGSTSSSGSSYWNTDNTGDAFTFHLEGSTHRITIWTFSQLRRSNITNLSFCTVSGQALVTSS